MTVTHRGRSASAQVPRQSVLSASRQEALLEEEPVEPPEPSSESPLPEPLELLDPVDDPLPLELSLEPLEPALNAPEPELTSQLGGGQRDAET